MRIERKLIKSARVLASKLFKNKAKPGSMARSRLEPVAELHPCSEGTRLVVRCGDRSLSRIISSQCVPEPTRLSHQWLQACQGNRGTVELTISGQWADFRWEERAFPSALRLELTPVETPVSLPQLTAVDRRLLSALAAASAAVDHDSLRYALHCVQLDGQRGTVTGTDGRQLIRFDGFRFPWNDQAILTPASDLFACAELRDVAAVACGMTDKQLVIEASPWTFWLPLELEGRFPNVEAIVTKYSKAVNRVYFDPRDLEFLVTNIRHIPGAEAEYAPLALDLNGHVELATGADEQSRPMRIRLSRSVHVGPAVCCTANRAYLHQAAKLGLTELLRFGESDPVVCRGEHIVHLWQPLTGVKIPEDGPETIKVDSALSSLAAAQ